MKSTTKQPSWLRRAIVTGAFVTCSASALAIVTDLTLVEALHTPAAIDDRLDQVADINALPNTDAERFIHAFVVGDEFFEVTHNILDGAGANVGDGTLFTRVPRADLHGEGQWADHFPPRSTGPNAQGCVECHNRPFGTQAGSSALAAHRDPGHTGDLGKMIRRDTPSLGGAGPLQILAEEMTTQLHSQRKHAGEKACRTGHSVTRALKSKGVKFGSIVAVPVEGHHDHCEPKFYKHKVRGIDHDLVVKPFQWKGSVATLRDFNRGALHNELGIQATELVGVGNDSDGDTVVDEASVGDVTGLVAYVAGQPRPTTLEELGDLAAANPGGDIDPLAYPALTTTERRTIRKGSRAFS